MKMTGRSLSKFLSVAAVCLALLFSASVTRAQSAAQDELRVKPTDADRAAAQSSTIVYRHARAANNATGKGLRALEAAQPRAVQPKAAAASSAGNNGPIFKFPGDVSYLGGNVVDFTTSHAVYMQPNGNCPVAVCWGNPEGFLKDLGRSEFIHITDQYIGLFAPDRYRVGFHAFVSYTPPSVPLNDADIQAVVHAVAAASGETGYGNIYDVFLPPGQDECFDSTDTECYSPDNPNTFFFCGYHSSVTFSDIGYVLYTVQPFEDVPGCQVAPGSPNGQMVDSQDSVLNHETFESITDPDGTAWINFNSLPMFENEVADECEFITISGPNAYFDVPVIRLNGHPYGVQSIYANGLHACATAP